MKFTRLHLGSSYDYELYSHRSMDDLQGDWKVWVLVTREVPLDLAPLLQNIFPGEFAVGGTSLL